MAITKIVDEQADLDCEFCFSRYHDSQTRPGTCMNCGAPAPKVKPKFKQLEEIEELPNGCIE
jgi:hypothetical protein